MYILEIVIDVWRVVSQARELRQGNNRHFAY